MQRLNGSWYPYDEHLISKIKLFITALNPFANQGLPKEEFDSYCKYSTMYKTVEITNLNTQAFTLANPSKTLYRLPTVNK